MDFLGKPEILILLIVILVLFGGKRLPGAARSLGQSMRILKAETKGLRSDDDATVPPAAPPAATQVVPPTTGAPGTMPIAPVPPAVQDQTAPPQHQ
jgi:sec-independent protein translocase protein TatA